MSSRNIYHSPEIHYVYKWYAFCLPSNCQPFTESSKHIFWTPPPSKLVMRNSASHQHFWIPPLLWKLFLFRSSVGKPKPNLKLNSLCFKCMQRESCHFPLFPNGLKSCVWIKQSPFGKTLLSCQRTLEVLSRSTLLYPWILISSTRKRTQFVYSWNKQLT